MRLPNLIRACADGVHRQDSSSYSLRFWSLKQVLNYGTVTISRFWLVSSSTLTRTSVCTFNISHSLCFDGCLQFLGSPWVTLTNGSICSRVWLDLHDATEHINAAWIVQHHWRYQPFLYGKRCWWRLEATPSTNSKKQRIEFACALAVYFQTHASLAQLCSTW